MTVKMEIELEVNDEIAKAWANKQDDESIEDAIINDVCCVLETATDCGIYNASIIDCEFFED